MDNLFASSAVRTRVRPYAAAQGSHQTEHKGPCQLRAVVWTGWIPLPPTPGTQSMVLQNQCTEPEKNFLEFLLQKKIESNERKLKKATEELENLR